MPAPELRLNVEIHATGQGRPVVALHGFLATLESWRGLVGRLPGRELWLFDLKGHGASPCPADGRYTVRNQADLVLAQLGAMRDVTLVGHSFGAGVALLVALELMQQARLARLVLVDALAFPDELSGWAKWLRDFWPIAYAAIPPFAVSDAAAVAAVRMGLKILCEQPQNISAASVQAYANNLRPPARANAMIQTGRNLTAENYAEIADGYRNIRVPTLIIWGRQDPLVPLDPSAGKLNQGIAGSTLFVPDDKCGHIAHEELPDLVLERIAAFV